MCEVTKNRVPISRFEPQINYPSENRIPQRFIIKTKDESKNVMKRLSLVMIYVSFFYIESDFIICYLCVSLLKVLDDKFEWTGVRMYNNTQTLPN